jgi:hypothetical protein
VTRFEKVSPTLPRQDRNFRSSVFSVNNPDDNDTNKKRARKYNTELEKTNYASTIKTTHTMNSHKKFMQDKRYTVMLPLNYRVTNIKIKDQNNNRQNAIVNEDIELKMNGNGIYKIKLLKKTAKIKI